MPAVFMSNPEAVQFSRIAKSISSTEITVLSDGKLIKLQTTFPYTCMNTGMFVYNIYVVLSTMFINLSM